MQHWTNSEDAEGPSPATPLASWYAQGMSDGLGDRLLMFDNTGGPSLELLRFRPDLAHNPEFEAALREQVQRLAFFQHPAFARVRSVKRLEPGGDLALVSNHTPGKRLSEVLHRAHGPALAAALIRQLAPALAQFQQHNPGISHGLLSPDRIVVSPDGRLTIVEHVIGPAIDALDLRLSQLSSIGISLPPAPADAIARLDPAADWYQLGLVALSVLVGRPVSAGELPQLESLLDRLGDSGGPSASIREWLQRALRISGERIESGADACAALDESLQVQRRRETPGLTASAEAAASAPEGSARERKAGAAHDAPEPAEAPGMSQAVDLAVEPAKVTEPPSPVTLQGHPVAEPAAVIEDAEPEPMPTAGHRVVSPAVRPSATGLSLFEFREATPAKTAPEPRVGRKPAGRRVVAVLAVIVVVQAAVIAWLARAPLAPAPAIAVATDPSGEGLAVNSASTGPAPLRLTVAPDLGWVRVTSPSVEGIVGAKVTGNVPGILRISSPIALKVLEGSRQLGSVPGADLKVPAGRHDIELVNVPLGYRSKQVLQVEAGQTVSIHVAPPHGWVTVDAAPWAEVTIDGQPMGRTPLGPLPLAIGEHTVAFRNPAGSSEKQRVTVRSEETIRVIGKLRF